MPLKNISPGAYFRNFTVICLKISRTVGILAKLRHSIPLSPLLNIYQAVINPCLYYGICAWGSALKTYLNIKILLIQKTSPTPDLLYGL